MRTLDLTSRSLPQPPYPVYIGYCALTGSRETEDWVNLEEGEEEEETLFAE